MNSIQTGPLCIGTFIGTSGSRWGLDPLHLQTLENAFNLNKAEGRANFGKSNANVLSIPLSRRLVCDKLVWHHTKSGAYLTCSGYNCARDMKRNGDFRSGVWGRRHWGLGRSLLEGYLEFKSSASSKNICLAMYQQYSTNKRSSPLWFATSLNICTTGRPWTSFKEWWTHMISEFHKLGYPENSDRLACVLWSLWKYRNGIAFGENALMEDMIWQASYQLYDSYQSACSRYTTTAQQGTVEENAGCKQPMQGWLKLNVDGGWAKARICRDANGTFRGAHFAQLPWVESAIVTKAMAAMKGLEFAYVNHWHQIQLESDSKLASNNVTHTIAH
ncbi:hypothetical protein LIER_19845 [Lithospermum erythrorhizon]|uniref:RNase H type-1 domain-containing protein n=1 Tax=Lithospermum erythrorhizon TaxID=34254 RepID=A0AAV3QKC0_LITER